MANESTVDYLNLDQRASRLAEINRENERTYKRLVDVSPSIDAFQIYLKNQANDKIKDKICKFDSSGKLKIDPLLTACIKGGPGKIPKKCQSIK